ncbi:MAG: rRNA maturation RNase YbeY [Chitinophagales bacterium]|nr:rRNA maturation RNase YbeY [Chitinophagales bacterium]MDW8428835.1 rRNA maturation RNase YbeY [Chitinophagales bacterium]
MAVTFTSLTRRFRLKHQGRLRRWLQQVAEAERTPLRRLHVVLTSDKHLYKLNKYFLNHSYFTDVLTFQYSAAEQPLEAEVFISVQRVADNARRLQLPMERELHRVMVHGLLHCLGYSDSRPTLARRMRKMEDHYLEVLYRSFR